MPDQECLGQPEIYAIGAAFFHAIIITGEVRESGYLYRDEYFVRLGEMVGESELVQASESNSHPRLKNALTAILQKCLCAKEHRYKDCRELLRDLELALYYALPFDVTNGSSSLAKWSLSNAGKSLDANREKNSFLAIQYHLFEYPLYQCRAEVKREGLLDDNVLVFGFGNYSQKFLDACLQNGQMHGSRLNVTVVSDDATDKWIYLSSRPGLADFFNIDGLLDGDDDAYGNINFEVRKLEKENQEVNARIMEDIICGIPDRRFPQYIFIALGEDELNYAAARACQSACDVLELRCLIVYVCEGEAYEEGSVLHPVFVNEDIKKTSLYPEIERMAFNAHLLWVKDLNPDYKKVKADFRKTYNHDSCVSNVLSLKYKLHSIGIELEGRGFDEAASRFCEIMRNSGEELRNELTWIEHRRWVTEKLCLGWTRMRKLEECEIGNTKDEKRKKHICIVRSRADRRLTAEFNRDGNYDKWDKASKKELDELDELDRLSVELHRMYKKKAEAALRNNLLTGSDIAVIRSMIEGDRKSMVAFQEWFACMKDIWHGDAGKARSYTSLKNAFLDASGRLNQDRAKSVEEHVKAFETMFYPVVASREYRDLKKVDENLIDNIPFVLTYTEDAYLVIPFKTGNDGNETEMFDNLAVPMLASPARILYLYLVESHDDLKKFLQAVPSVLSFMRKRNFKASVEFAVLCIASAATLINESVEEEVMKFGEGKVWGFKKIVLDSLDDISPVVGAYLRKRRKGKRFFALERNRTRLSSLLQGGGLFKVFPNYEFESGSMEFRTPYPGCDMLGYITKKPAITVADMAALHLSSSVRGRQPEFFADYKDLWNKYTENQEVWKNLCGLLESYARKNDMIACFPKKGPEDRALKEKKYTYLIPYICRESADRIIRFLKNGEFLEAGSHVSGYTTDSCEVTIVDRCDYRSICDGIFSNPYALMIPDAIGFFVDGKKNASVTFDSLIVSEIALPRNKEDEYRDLLAFFAGKGYIINMPSPQDGRAAQEGKASFVYATRQIKELLTTAGKMLEVYIYHSARATGYFDDVVNSYEVDWGNTAVKSEFDCIITKGFRTLFVECKSRFKMEQEFYQKLYSLAKKFGINATAVLIADSPQRSFQDSASVNAMQMLRGDMMDIYTIWKRNEIENIGQTLLDILEGRYERSQEIRMI